MAHHVFLSYSHKDLEIMRRVKNGLLGAGFTVWTDESIQPGTPLWDDAIEEALKKAQCMVVILSTNAINAKGLRDELHYARIHKVQIFPLLAEGSEQSSVPYVLSGTQWIDIRQNYEDGIQKLCIILRERLGIPSKTSLPKQVDNLPQNADISFPQPEQSQTQQKLVTSKISSHPKKDTQIPKPKGIRTNLGKFLITLTAFAILLLIALPLLSNQINNIASLKSSTPTEPFSTKSELSSNTPTQGSLNNTMTPTLKIQNTRIPSSTPATTLAVTGVIASLENVNLREAPTVGAGAVLALKPNTSVEVLGTSPDGKWFNIRIVDGREGWIATTLVRLNSVSNIIPIMTSLTNETATAMLSNPFVGVTFTPSADGVGSEGNTNSQSGVDVLAYCDNKVFGRPAPNNLTAGATIDVFWSWYFNDQALMQQHLDNVNYDVRVDGKSLDNWREFATSIRKGSDGNFYIFWYVPAGPLAAGQHSITYNVSWKAQITDGYDVFGPGTNRPSESGSCTFTVK